MPLGRSSTSDQPHSRVGGQALGIIGVLVACQATVDRLAQQRDEFVLHIASTPALLQVHGCRSCQAEGIIQLLTSQETSVRGRTGTEFPALIGTLLP